MTSNSCPVALHAFDRESGRAAIDELDHDREKRHARGERGRSCVCRLVLRRRIAKVAELRHQAARAEQAAQDHATADAIALASSGQVRAAVVALMQHSENFSMRSHCGAE